MKMNYDFQRELQNLNCQEKLKNMQQKSEEEISENFKLTSFLLECIEKNDVDSIIDGLQRIERILIELSELDNNNFKKRAYQVKIVLIEREIHQYAIEKLTGNKDYNINPLIVSHINNLRQRIKNYLNIYGECRNYKYN